MKKFIGMFLAVCILLSGVAPYAFADSVNDAQNDMPTAFFDEEAIWGYLSEFSPTDQITAGIMGFFYRESRLKPDSVAGWPARDYGLDESICFTFTRDIDKGLHNKSTREQFIQTVNIHFGGYGLGQWSSIGYLEHFYDFMSDKGGSIGDPKLQCEFIFESLKANEALWEELLQCTTALQCGRRMGYKYDGTGELGSETIASVADYYYGRFHQEDGLSEV